MRVTICGFAVRNMQEGDVVSVGHQECSCGCGGFAEVTIMRGDIEVFRMHSARAEDGLNFDRTVERVER